MPEHDTVAPELLERISIARQPIVDIDRTVLAYELFNRSTHAKGHSEASDIALALNAVASSGSPFGTLSHDVFIHSVHRGLTGPQWDFLAPARTVIEIGPAPRHDAGFVQALVPALQALKSRGFRLAFKHSVVAPVYRPWQGLADFVKLDSSSIDPAQLKLLVQAARQRTPAILIAEKVENQVQFEGMAEQGIAEFQGYWFSVPETTQSKLLTPAQGSAIHLFQLLKTEAGIDAVETALKKDAALGVSLLRIINAAGTGMPQKVTSLRQAVMLLGYERLVRWSALLLTNTSAHASIPSTSAVVRGRMMELLAQHLGDGETAGAAFLVGLLSQIDSLLGLPMQELLPQLALDDSVCDALLSGKGLLGSLLALVCACETDHEADFNTAYARLPFSLKQINVAHMEALVWADSLAG
ncbi:HDOD domain-containing protein [Rhodoferax sp.]|uniref:EAL and HDOD domain-containing protein n=1 Tax=Rhodoferax sp. TaxID=50421 RepID=UPI0025D2AE64|nr:HDOD domain-containing protein [Rhodoferax sp.]